MLFEDAQDQVMLYNISPELTCTCDRFHTCQQCEEEEEYKPINIVTKPKQMETKTKKEILKQLYIKNGLVEEDIFQDRRGFWIITRTGIDKIARKNGIKLDYKIEAMLENWCVIRCTASHPDMGEMQSFGEASKENCTSMAAKFPVAMAEKRAKSSINVGRVL